MDVVPSTTPSFNALLILPDDPARPNDHPLSSLNAVRMHIKPLNIELDSNGNPTARAMQVALGPGLATFFRELYHRDPAQISWYYTVYGLHRREQVDRSLTFNTLANRIVQVGGFQGPALVVKGGPVEMKGDWLNADWMTVDALATTLWWYHRTGQRTEQIAGERALARYITRNF
ncbi:hypothetical protein FA95DRAFT_1608989 [Auriscalpium vulgare]|uniref:Uncharacterized protein n=1 Tax=Auriscalpium vulgare TaxID=40419 RepID=A0ACB8RIH0_9AGAM|nr:hypothetical protein FA95DRAFT_1608989 [Auriscalpium vulgare]